MKMAWYDKSLDYLLQAQQLFGEVGDTNMQARGLMNVGIVHDYLSNFPMALSYYQKALDYFTRTSNANGIADCKQNVAIVLAKQRKYEKACENLVAAAEIYKKAGNESNLGAAYINLGLTYKKMGNHELAIEYLNKALAIWEKAKNPYFICFYHMNMGEIMLDLKKNDQAFVHLNQAEAIAQKLGLTDLLSKVYEFLADYNAAERNYPLAYSYLDKSKNMNDSILNAETTEKVNQVQYHYEIARREADNGQLVQQNLDKELQLSKQNQTLYILSGILFLIVVLTMFFVNQYRIKQRANRQLEAQNDLIESQKNELVMLNASKDKFLSILAHDIKNPLSGIFGISELLLSDYDKLTENNKKVLTQDLHTLTANLFEIINTLLTWSMAQNGLIACKPSAFSIAELCQKSANNLQAVAKQKNIVLAIDADGSLEVMADENMVLSVLYNLISNAIKYSYRGTKIRIESRTVNGLAEIRVIDTGLGLSPESQAKLFQYDQHFLCKGTAGESGTGLGLILCKDFVEKNGGTIRVDSVKDKGSTFTFTLPVA
jgi:signal transduction histidine kinase